MGNAAITLTARARLENITRTRSLAAGFQVHLAEPITPEDLLTAVATVAQTAAVASRHVQEDGAAPK